MNRAAMAAAACLAALATLHAASLPEAWNHWRYFRPIELGPANAPRLADFIVPQEVYPRTQTGLGDLRIIDDRGAEVPFARLTRGGSSDSVALPTTLRENSFAAGLYTQLVLDVGAKPPFHNAVEINTPETDFIEWAQVEASDDAHVWRVVQGRAPIFRFEKQGREGTQTLRYSENNARYLRVRILEKAGRFPVSGAAVYHTVVEPPERVSLHANLVPEASPPAGQTAWRVDLGTPALSINEIRFSSAPASEFSRNVVVETSEDGKAWSNLANASIYRFHSGEAMEEQLTVRLPGEAERRYWRIAVINGNDAPVPSIEPILFRTPQHFLFEQQAGRSYRLLYGQTEAKRPEYDLQRRLNDKQIASAVAARLGTEEANADYSDPRPWTERHEFLLWLVLGVAIALLGLAALRSLRHSTSPTSA